MIDTSGRWARIMLGLILLEQFIYIGGCQSSPPPPLYDRLGGSVMITALTADFVQEAWNDPRVNFTRNAEWQPTPENIDRLEAHLTEYFEAATGGSQEYRGKDMRTAHANMQISNAEFDAIVDDLGKSLSKYKVPAQESSELLAIVQATRKDIVQAN